MLEQPKVSYPGRHLHLQEGMIYEGGLVCVGSTANALTIAKQRRESGFKLRIPPKQHTGMASSALY